MGAKRTLEEMAYSGTELCAFFYCVLQEGYLPLAWIDILLDENVHGVESVEHLGCGFHDAPISFARKRSSQFEFARSRAS